MSAPKRTAGSESQPNDISDTEGGPANVTKSAAQAISLPELPNLSLFHCLHRLRGQQRVIGEPYWGTTEHASLGDNLLLKIPNSNANQPGQEPYKTWCTKSKKFNFHELDSTLNGQILSYGEINALAGDFYATYEPISGDAGKGHPDPKEATRRFCKAWELLAVQPKSVQETQAILAQNKKFEDDVLEKYKSLLSDHQVSWIYATKMASAAAQTVAFWKLTNSREGSDYGNETYPSYIGILLNNFDHFGHDAHFAYSVGHQKALELACDAGKENDEKKLMVAYAMNAFAEHYLEDAFSAGHLRTPRRDLHGFSVGEYTIPPLDLCANLMHDEDNALGIRVRNKRVPNPDTWTCVGDDYLHDTTDGAKATLKYCKEALQASADEIWDAYHTHKVTEPGKYKALTIAPDLDSVLEKPDDGKEYVAPLYKLFDGELKERNWSFSGIPWIGRDLQLNRTNWSDNNYTSFGSVEAGLYYLPLNNSGWWNYPLQLDAASPDPS